MAWYSQRANFFTSNVVPREEHLHGWEGALTVSNPSGGGGHAEIVFTVEGVGCATVGKGQQHVFTINEHNNNAASRFVINYMLMDGEWGEVPATPSVVGGTTSSSVGLEPYGSIVVVPTALLAVNACTITLGTKIESITATLRGINESSGYAATPIVRPNQHKYFYLNGKAPEALQGELPINDAGEPITDVSLAVCADSLEESIAWTAANNLVEYNKIHFNESFPVFRGTGGFKSLAQFVSLTQTTDDPKTALETGNSIILNYTVHRMAQYEVSFRAPLTDLLLAGNTGGFIVIDADVQNSVHLDTLTSVDQYAYDKMPYIARRGVGTHYLVIHLTAPSNAAFFGTMEGLMEKLAKSATVEWVMGLDGVYNPIELSVGHLLDAPVLPTAVVPYVGAAPPNPCSQIFITVHTFHKFS